MFPRCQTLFLRAGKRRSSLVLLRSSRGCRRWPRSRRRSAGIARELQSIRAHLGRLAADNAEVGRLLGESLGPRNPPDAPRQ